MTLAPRILVDAFGGGRHDLDDPDPVRPALRAAGPIVRVDAPAGGSAWIITDDELARAVLVDPRIVKDPACAPEGWDPRSAGLEPTAAQQLSLTTADGEAHARLRHAHAPLFGARRMQAQYPQLLATARELLTALAAGPQPVDLVADFTSRFPLIVICDLLGVPRERIDQAADACRRVLDDYPAGFGVAMGQFAELAAAALGSGRPGLATELRDRFPEGVAAGELHYHLIGMIFAAQLTTDAALGFLLARVLGREPGTTGDAAPTRSSGRRCGDTRPPRTPCGGSPTRRSSWPGPRCRPGRRC